jgi:hypothetical protein
MDRVVLVVNLQPDPAIAVSECQPHLADVDAQAILGVGGEPKRAVFEMVELVGGGRLPVAKVGAEDRPRKERLKLDIVRWCRFWGPPGSLEFGMTKHLKFLGITDGAADWLRFGWHAAHRSPRRFRLKNR